MKLEKGVTTHEEMILDLIESVKELTAKVEVIDGCMTSKAAVGSPEDAVLSWLKGRSFGSIRVNEVTFALDQSADGQPLVRFTVTLDDPEPGQETWPFDDIQSMLRSIDDQAVAEGIESRWSTSFQQTSPEDFSTDDDLEKRVKELEEIADRYDAVMSSLNCDFEDMFPEWGQE